MVGFKVSGEVDSAGGWGQGKAHVALVPPLPVGGVGGKVDVFVKDGAVKGNVTYGSPTLGTVNWTLRPGAGRGPTSFKVQKKVKVGESGVSVDGSYSGDTDKGVAHALGKGTAEVAVSCGRVTCTGTAKLSKNSAQEVLSVKVARDMGALLDGRLRGAKGHLSVGSPLVPGKALGSASAEVSADVLKVEDVGTVRVTATLDGMDAFPKSSLKGKFTLADVAGVVMSIEGVVTRGSDGTVAAKTPKIAFDFARTFK